MGACVLACTKDPRNLNEKEMRYIEPSNGLNHLKEIQRELQNPPQTVESSQPYITRRQTAQEDHIIESQAEVNGQNLAEVSSTMKKSRFCPEELKNSSSTSSGAGQLTPAINSSLHKQTSHRRESLRDFSIKNSANIKLPKINSSKVAKQLLKENTNPQKFKKSTRRSNLDECSINNSLKVSKSVAQAQNLSLKKSSKKTQKIIQSITQNTSTSSPQVKTSLTKNTDYLENHLLPSTEQKPFDQTSEALIKSTLNFHKPTLLTMTVKFLDGAQYLGEWMNGMKNGKGILTWSDGVYEGHWKDNLMEGKGKIMFQNGQSYDGHFSSHKAQGDGTFIFSNGSLYRGKWHQNKQQGYGVHQWAKNEYYSGNWHEGAKQGYGQLIYPDGSFYKGHFDHNQFHGQGQYCWADKRSYKGEWKHNKKDGHGQLTMENGEKYTGAFENDKMHGKGRYQQVTGVVYEGTWVHGKKEGIVDQIRPDGQRRTGMWYFGKFVYNIDKQTELSHSKKQKHKGCRYSH